MSLYILMWHEVCGRGKDCQGGIIAKRSLIE